jgi:hypothetical protein
VVELGGQSTSQYPRTAQAMYTDQESQAFDIMGELSFGESLQCLDTTSSHFFVKVLFEGLEAGSVMGYLNRYGIWTIIESLLPKSFLGTPRDMVDCTIGLVGKRLEQGYVEGKTDLFNHLLKGKGKTGGKEIEMTREELNCNGLVFVAAGADTTATLLTFTLWLLCKDARVLAQVQHEVRTAYSSDADMSFEKCSKLKYMLAVLSEGLRLFPPGSCTHCLTVNPCISDSSGIGPSALARHIVNKEGQMVAGHFVPFNVSQALLPRCSLKRI